MKKIGIDVDLDKKHKGLGGNPIFIESESLISWAQLESKSFESILSRDINNGRKVTEIPEAYILLMNSYSILPNKFDIEVPYLEVNIQYCDIEGNEYHDTWNFNWKRIIEQGDTRTLNFKAIKK